MSGRSFREPGKPAPAEPVKKWPRMWRCAGNGRSPPRRDVVAKLVARAIAAAEAREKGK